MVSLRFVTLLATLTLLLFSPPLQAQTAQAVTTHRYDGLALGGMQYGKLSAERPVILLIHDTMSHMHDPALKPWIALFKQLNATLLTINLSYNQAHRQGPLPCDITHTHRHGDALVEIPAWLAWLRRAGVQKVFLAGQGRGANQVAWYASESYEKIMAGLLLIDPMESNFEQTTDGYKARFGTPLQPLLGHMIQMNMHQMENMAQSDIGFLTCDKVSVTPASFFSYYNDDARQSTAFILTQMRMPHWIAAHNRPYKSSLSEIEKLLNEHVNP
uniref:AB hydrolase-1 domain-containing protein n=1 Tax=Magnetococcus massalia (strain MO-1) TaxID=451514 RepID=A0A1S7LLN7_MAGMO|nr:Exported protein of unknown function [Candidatus Magnetococcus massalia]